MERRNVNRGFKKLIVWQDAIELFVLANNIFLNFPFELKKTVENELLKLIKSLQKKQAQGDWIEKFSYE